LLALVGATFASGAAPVRADTPSPGSSALKSAAGLAPAVLLNGAGNYVMLESLGFLGPFGLAIAATSPFAAAGGVTLVGRGVDGHGRYGAALGGAWLGAAVGAALYMPVFKWVQGERRREWSPRLLPALTAVLSIPITAFATGFYNFSARRNERHDESVVSSPVYSALTAQF
jgi:hypothetical protein